MKLTKYEHACFTVEKDDKLLVVNPGSLSANFIVPANVVAVVITHEHANHFSLERLTEIIDKNPDAIPAAAPWMKIGDAMDYLQTVWPRFAFPTHDAVASEAGKALADRLLNSVAAAQNTTYQRLADSIVI